MIGFNHKLLRIATTLLLLTPGMALSSFEFIPLSSRQEAMGGVSGGCGSPCALWLNPASAAEMESSYLTSTYTRLWGLSELSLSSFAYTHPFSFGNLSAGISDFGCSSYRENIGCLSFATELGSALDIGMNLKWMRRSIGDELVDNVVSIDGGLILSPINEFMIEVSSHNISSPAIGVESLHQDLLTGFIYQPAKELLISLNLLKQPPYPIQLCVGEEFKLTEWFIQRAGVKQNPTMMTLGFGIRFSPLQFDYAALLHPLLGTSHSFSLSAVKF